MGAAALVAAAPVQQSAPGKPVSFGQKGGSGVSADKKWRIYTKGPSAGVLTLWIKSADTPERKLTSYDRDGTLIWLSGGRHALFVHKGQPLNDVRLFTLYGDAAPLNAVQSSIEKSMAAVPPGMARVDKRKISARPGPNGVICLDVEEVGPPRKAGPPAIMKTGMYRVSGNGSVLRVKSCGVTGKID